MSDYLDDLDDKEQWERVLRWLREQGPWMLGTVVVVLAAFGGWRYWQARTNQRDLAASQRYEQVLDTAGQGNMSLATTLADRLIQQYPGTPYAAQAELVAARLAVQNNQLPQAAQRLRKLMDSTHDPELALLVRLRLARVQIAEGQSDEALGTLSAVKPGAFAAAYSEARGDALLAKGDRPGALQAYLAARRVGGGTLDTQLLQLKIDDLARS